MAVVIQRQWRRRQSARYCAALADVRDAMCRCCVCHDETTSVVSCINGHATCTGCDVCIDDPLCPLCRQPRHTVANETVCGVARHLRMGFKCTACNVTLSNEAVEFHRAWCRKHAFQCPVHDCRVTAANVLAHVKANHTVTDVSQHKKYTMLLSRHSSNVTLVVDDVVVVASFTQEVGGTALEQLMTTHLALHIKGYYANASARPLTVTVMQKRVSDVFSNTALETFQLGIVPPVIASRERVAVPTYTPRIVPRCVITTNVQDVGTVPVRLRTCADLIHYGVCDVPVRRHPARSKQVVGIPAAIVELSFATAQHATIGAIYSS